MNDKYTIIKYLKLANVNDLIINYISNEKDILQLIINLLGKDFLSKNNESICVEKLKTGFPTFKILEDGSIWFSSLKIVDTSNKINLNEKNYNKIYYSNHILIINGLIYIRTYCYKGYSKKDILYYDCEVKEEIFNQTLKKIQVSVSKWDDSIDANIPDYGIETCIERVNELGLIQRIKILTNYNDSSWNFVKTGKKDNTNKVLSNDWLKLKSQLDYIMKSNTTGERVDRKL